MNEIRWLKNRKYQIGIDMFGNCRFVAVPTENGKYDLLSFIDGTCELCVLKEKGHIKNKAELIFDSWKIKKGLKHKT